MSTYYFHNTGLAVLPLPYHTIWDYTGQADRRCLGKDIETYPVTWKVVTIEDVSGIQNVLNRQFVLPATTGHVGYLTSMLQGCAIIPTGSVYSCLSIRIVDFSGNTLSDLYFSGYNPSLPNDTIPISRSIGGMFSGELDNNYLVVEAGFKIEGNPTGYFSGVQVFGSYSGATLLPFFNTTITGTNYKPWMTL